MNPSHLFLRQDTADPEGGVSCRRWGKVTQRGFFYKVEQARDLKDGAWMGLLENVYASVWPQL